MLAHSGYSPLRQKPKPPRMPSIEVPLQADLTKPHVSATRRTRGTMIALALLTVFLAGAMWWVYATAASVVGTQTAPATKTQP